MRMADDSFCRCNPNDTKMLRQNMTPRKSLSLEKKKSGGDAEEKERSAGKIDKREMKRERKKKAKETRPKRQSPGARDTLIAVESQFSLFFFLFLFSKTDLKFWKGYLFKTYISHRCVLQNRLARNIYIFYIYLYILYIFFGSHKFDRRPEGRALAVNAMLYLFDSFRYGFFFNLATLERAARKCKSILPSSLLALVRAS
ncbi:hypothetical protein PUN28_004887 [Cardiocondyla obscurior]|uniref:Transmembrane protein n=1 Tax=Cardiocondyla obscurior TaxID=286306 RepID=A0AAW2GFN7_9HYME